MISGTQKRGTIYFDSSCGLCATSARRMERIFASRGFDLMPLQADGVAAKLGLRDGQVPGEMKLRLADGRTMGGAEALLELSQYVWWMRPLRIARYLPGGKSAAGWVYRRVARHRHSISKACDLSADEESAFSHCISLSTEITVSIAPTFVAIRLASLLPFFSYFALTFSWAGLHAA